MSGEKKEPGVAAFGWWAEYLEQRDTNPAARGLAARLRRAGPIEALCEPAVHKLAQALHVEGGEMETAKLIRLACLLAEVRERDAVPLAHRLGGSEPVLSRARFENLMRAEGANLTDLMRRAIVMADRRCNVGALARDLWHWNDRTRTHWCFAYFHADAPQNEPEETV
ncbi:type I-E CRISPR-associated protein Cse2/CasB [Acidomonas methanolica]|uniref:type I-E CRISPR-associated protein Cse2/CasB n=1 Tax=Acidomonas methanolica TaxID=437 RepID=UPI00211A15DE|nr:type I-E CRISPR-associated protein Cse2/CasB [Acidomonas methanolica]MCQ9156513.1 type I-E CRISPR-associated protein Cse2/CasB [Acidomonas methanolica]